MFNPELSEKPYIVAYNKMDLPEAYAKWPLFKERLQARGIEPFCMSAVQREGTHEVISAAYQLLQKNKEAKREFQGSFFSHFLNLFFYFFIVSVNVTFYVYSINYNPLYVRHT